MPSLRGALGSLPFLKPSQFRAQRAVFFHQAVRLRLQFLEIGARLLEHLLFHGPRRLAFIEQPLITLLLIPRPAAFLPQAFQFQPRN